VKLVVEEEESAALRRELDDWDEWISCAVSQPEVIRACRLASAVGLPASTTRALTRRVEAVFGTIALLDADLSLLRDASALDPVKLRTLEATHLAAALSLGSEMSAVFTYDRRLATAARQHGLEVRSPS
jgi:predicted nucleic acid-binding protein